MSAPLSKPSMRSSTAILAERMMSGMCMVCLFCFTRCVNSSPSMPGIIRSVIIRSGVSFFSISSPFPASVAVNSRQFCRLSVSRLSNS